MKYETVALILLLAMLAVSIATDLRAGKIYNAVTVSCALAGLALAAAGGGIRGIGDHLLGVVVVVLILLVLAPLGRLGGGDIKLLMAVGALQGLSFALWALLFTGIAGGLLALGVTIRRRQLKRAAAAITVDAVSLAMGVPDAPFSRPAAGKMLYSLAIAAGALAALAMRIV